MAKMKSKSLLRDKRHLKLGVSDPAYGDNSIRTSKYTLYNFFIINLFEQFMKIANLYFLILSMLQIVPQISISNSQPTILIPLLFVVVVSMMKDFIEDRKRSKSDNEENNSPVLVFRNGQFVNDKWANIHSGEFVKVLQDQFMPADLLLLYSTSKKPECFVETKSLDGETNLKTKYVIQKFREYIQTESQISSLEAADFHFEAPNPFIYKFSGSVTYRDTQIGIEANNFLLRNSKLKNTAFIIGVVSFTGHFTKIMMNSIKSKKKLSDIEKKVSWLMFSLFLLLVVLVLTQSTLYTIWYDLNIDYFGYSLMKRENLVGVFFINLGNWLLIFG